VSGYFHAPAALPLRVGALGTHCIGGLVGPRAGLDALVEKKIPALPLPLIEPWSSSS